MHQYNPRPIKTVLGLDAKSLLKELSYLLLSFTLFKFKSVIFTLLSLEVDIFTCTVFIRIIGKLNIQSSNRNYVLCVLSVLTFSGQLTVVVD